ncbi:4-hydroxyphenylacetate 3-hydroxylase family protein [Bacilliculturomica massiliensis]|uniref:4-hydroxyphenylacetate 3-hydroxylase family protein n=1 Tax=Bacilliculturomica massiliensis TaxID=1917867 RepID=UPI00102F9151|nr:4-hydroxyphenylacetate 3-hydroxylase N-terminal domain-containing protein [Bacilliculturomica massiliensis]
MRTQEQYLEGLKKMRPNIYLDGECIGRDDPRVVRASSAIRMTFSLVDNPEYEDLLTATSHISGKKINRFTHIHQSVDDLLKKQEMTRKICGACGGCVQRCMGIDMMNAISGVSYDVDQKYGTSYYQNFLKFLEYFQENDLVCAGSQTDTKGDRAARPSQQWDPDQYLHVVERRPDGVVVRGCKVHNTMAPYADELLIVPTRVMGPDEKDYAIAFAIPADTEGIYLIAREAFSTARKPEMDAPITSAGDLESMTVFDDVFIPNERIFLNGEVDMAGKMALRFALYHRHSYTGCKPGIGDVIMGTAALIADYQNIKKQGHVKEKLAEMISVAELVYAAGIASAVKSTKAASGTQVPNVIYANVGRRHAGHNIYHEFNMLCDITGGLPATIPGTAEYLNPEISKYVQKYVTRREGISPEDCYRAFMLASDLLTGEYSTVVFQVAGVHGGGSPIMEDIAILGSYDLNAKVNIAKHLAGIEVKDEEKK